MTKPPNDSATTRLTTRFLWGAVAVAIVIRLMPWVLMRLEVPLDFRVTTYPWNFSPVTAVCLFGAAYASRAGRSLLVPLVIGLVGDLGIGLVSGRIDYGFYSALPFVYVGHLLSTSLGLAFVRRQDGSPRTTAVLGTGVAAEVVFFLVSNLGVWWTGTRYPHDASGLLACYVAALPYLRNGLIGTAVYGTTLFVGFDWLRRRSVEPRPTEVPVAGGPIE